ncbi:MAG: hypothetical protein V3R71_01620 [Gemmatimonadales bacterium]
MARADRRTLLPMDEWFRIMGINPLHGNQVQLESLQNSFCGTLWFQHQWQEGTQIGREDLAEAIAQAEHLIKEYVGYSLLADWITDERRPTIRPNRPELINLGTSDVRWYSQVAIGDAKKWISGGQRATTLIDADATIVYSSSVAPADYDDLATVIVAAGALTDTCEIRVFYPGKAADPLWEIKPLRSVTLTGGNFVITFDRHQAVLEELQEAYLPAAVDGTDDANFLTEVDVYRVFNDPQSQANLLWEPLPQCACPTGSSVTCVICQYGTQTGCLIARADPDNTILAYHPATWNATTEQFDPAKLSVGRQPDLIRMWYYAGHEAKGLDCPRVTMDPYWAVVVAHFAAALLRKPPCECNKLDFQYWQQDLSYIGGIEEASAFNLSPADLANPFGKRRGAIEAWRAVNSPGVQLLNSSVSV